MRGVNRSAGPPGTPPTCRTRHGMRRRAAFRGQKGPKGHPHGQEAQRLQGADGGVYMAVVPALEISIDIIFTAESLQNHEIFIGFALFFTVFIGFRI